MIFSVIRHDKPNSLARRKSERPEHLKYLETVLDKIVYGGALLNERGEQDGSILIIDVADRAAAEAFAAADPYVEAELFESTLVEQFRLVFKDGAWL